MKRVLITGSTLLMLLQEVRSQIIPNGDFKKWGNEYDKCPTGWGCNNDEDCPGKVTQADKVKGGAKLTVTHCWDIKKDDRSNNVNLNYDDLSAKIPKGKKAKISFDYSYVPVGSDQAYIKIDIDIQEELEQAPSFVYNDAVEGWLKPNAAGHMECYVNFTPSSGKNYAAPQSIFANSIRTTFGIMPASGKTDVNKGSTLIINHVKFTVE